MKDKLTVEQRKELIEKYPYLMPRNSFTGEPVKIYDYSFIWGEYKFPDGWFQLFLQCCEDLYEPLKTIDYLDKFYFTQIKEKYGRMTLYVHGATEEIHRIIQKYTFLSEQTCSICGIPATVVTWGYVCPYCSEHVLGSMENVEDAEIIEIKTSFDIDKWSPEGSSVEHIDCSDEWERYLKRIEYENET